MEEMAGNWNWVRVLESVSGYGALSGRFRKREEMPEFRIGNQLLLSPWEMRVGQSGRRRKSIEMASLSKTLKKEEEEEEEEEEEGKQGCQITLSIFNRAQHLRTELKLITPTTYSPSLWPVKLNAALYIEPSHVVAAVTSIMATPRRR